MWVRRLHSVRLVQKSLPQYHLPRTMLISYDIRMKMLFEISACMESLQMQQTGFLTQPFFMKQKNVECTKSASICLLRRCCIVVCSFYAHVALSSEREKVQRKCAVFFGAHTLSHVIEYSSYCALFSEQHHFHWMFTSYVINKIIILQLNFTLERWIVAIRRISRTRHLKLSAWRSRNLNEFLRSPQYWWMKISCIE